MEPTINFQQSIVTKRLKYTGSLIDYILMHSSSILFIAIGVLFFIGNFQKMSWVFLILNALYIIWMISNLILFNVLVKIEGRNSNLNRELIIKILNERFNLNITDEDQVVIKNEKTSGLFWGRVVCVLFKDNDAYINIQRLGRFDAISIFHGLGSYLNARKIKRVYESFSNAN